ncbi:MAG: hypothetical protein M1814_000306 [Vezdaea aestivalis]|nr:MAG: hypothetical protein M1814_000306 [Vezdaea aestivalis]
MDSNHARLYIGLAFTAGILLTLGFKDAYPDLERRFRRARSHRDSEADETRDTSIRFEDNNDGAVHPQDPSFSSFVNGIEGTIGHTPLIKIKSLSEATGCEILAKAEFLNGAGGSPKDRVALAIINSVRYGTSTLSVLYPSLLVQAEVAGLITPNSGDTIYEGTVGSTGISLATICRARGYHAHICMPDDQAHEKSSLLLKLGATVERVRPASIVDKDHFVNRAKQLAQSHASEPSKSGKGYFADQFETDANWRAHFDGTGPEIFKQAGGRLDVFIAGAGTGGTISGVAMYLKPRLPKLQIVLADPQGSGLFNKIKHGVMFNLKESEGTRRRHQVDTIVEGIGLNRLTSNLNAGRHLIDDAIKVSDSEAATMATWLVERDGIFVGSSSAVNCVAALQMARGMGPGHRIITVLCDSGSRHLSKFWAEVGGIRGKSSCSLDEIAKL